MPQIINCIPFVVMPTFLSSGAVRHELEISSAGRSLAGNPVKLLMSLYGAEWKERGCRLRSVINLGCCNFAFDKQQD
jgi:hypothetical protein